MKITYKQLRLLIREELLLEKLPDRHTAGGVLDFTALSSHLGGATGQVFASKKKKKEKPPQTDADADADADADVDADLNLDDTDDAIDEYDVINEQDYKEFKDYLKEIISISEGPISLEEAEYRGRKVKLNKPMQGDVAKFKVYVKNPKGNVVKVNFGAKGMRIRKNNPKARKSFRARHRCDNPGPRHKARYWSCRKW